MSTEPTHPRGEAPTAKDGREQIERDIEQTRADLGATVEALAAKADLKSRGKQKFAEVRQQAAARPDLTAAVAGSVAALLVLLVVWRRSR